MSSKLEAVIWSCDASQQIPCFDGFQLTCYKPSMGVCLSAYLLEYSLQLAQLQYCHCAFTPTSNTASHDNHEKIN